MLSDDGNAYCVIQSETGLEDWKIATCSLSYYHELNVLRSGLSNIYAFEVKCKIVEPK